MWTELDLRFSPELKEEMDGFLSSCNLYSPVLSLQYSSTDSEPEEKWIYAAYSEDKIPELNRIACAAGINFLYIADGYKLVIIQPHLLEKLEGKTLTRNKNLLVAI